MYKIRETDVSTSHANRLPGNEISIRTTLYLNQLLWARRVDNKLLEIRLNGNN